MKYNLSSRQNLEILRNGSLKNSSKNIKALKQAALLHDTLEDTDATPEEIEKMFGSLVLSIVKELTSDSSEIKKQGKTEYLKSYSMSFARLFLRGQTESLESTLSRSDLTTGTA